MDQRLPWVNRSPVQSHHLPWPPAQCQYLSWPPSQSLVPSWLAFQSLVSSWLLFQILIPSWLPCSVHQCQSEGIREWLPGWRIQPLVSARATSIPRSSDLLTSETVRLDSVLPVMAFTILCVWARHTTAVLLEVAASSAEAPEVVVSVPVPESIPEPTPVPKSTPEPAPALKSAPVPSSWQECSSLFQWL